MPNPTTMESAVRLLIHARNSHGEMRPLIRHLIHHDIALLRRARSATWPPAPNPPRG